MQIKKDVQARERRMKNQAMPRRDASKSAGIGRRDGSRLGVSQQPNRIVSPEERPVKESAAAGNNDEADRSDSEDESGIGNRGVEEPDGDGSADEDAAFVVTSWLDALSNVLPEEDADYDNDVSFDYITEATLAGMVGGATTDDPPEKRPANLPALPADNVAAFPQEDKRYLSRLKNVRSDKFSLHWMLFNDVELPSMLSVYGSGD